MRKIVFASALTVLLPAVLAVGETSLEKHPIPKTVDQALAEKDRIIAKANQPGRMAPQFRMEWAAPLLRFLDSPDDAIRRVAVEALPDIQDVLLDDCLPYLSPDRPLTERVAVLVLCIGQLSSYGEECSSKDSGQKVKDLAKEMMGQPVCPPSFVQLVVALAKRPRPFVAAGYSRGVGVNEVVAQGNEPLAARRFLAALPSVPRLYPVDALGIAKGHDKLPQRVFELVLSLGEKNTGGIVEDWYKTELDAAVRSVVVEKSLSWSQSPEWAARRKGVLELAAQDWDQGIAARAKALLAQAK